MSDQDQSPRAMAAATLDGVFSISFDSDKLPVVSFGVWSLEAGWFDFTTAAFVDTAFDAAKHARGIVPHPHFPAIKIAIVPAAASVAPPFHVVPFTKAGDGLKAGQPLDYGVKGSPIMPPMSWTITPA